MKFNYQARTKKGEIHTGQIEASSKEATIVLLQKNGLYVTFLEKATSPIYAKKIKIFEKISRKDIVLFSRQLSIMFKSKATLIESLRVLADQTKNSNFKEKILKISEEVDGGTLFSKALARYPKTFSSFYVAMIKSGEVSGKLSEVLDYLAEHLEREYHLTARTRGALIYPALIIFVVVAVLILMVLFVIPQLKTVLEESGEALPFLTKFVMGLTPFFKKWGWLVILGVASLIFFSFRYYSSEEGKKIFDKIFLRLPMMGSLLKMVYLSRFAENLSTLISGGLPIAQALETVAGIIGNNSYKEVIFEAREAVRRGEPISSVLAKAPKLFPPMFVQMTLVGERTGTLDTALLNIVNFYRKEADTRIDSFLSVLEPALIIFLGIIVAGFMLSILMPLYRMMAL